MTQTPPSVRPTDLDTDARREAQTGDDPDLPGRGRRALRAVREFVQLFVVALVMAFIIKSLVLQAFYIPSGSMLETLQLQDRVLVEKLTYHFREPQRGEVIVFRRPGLERDGFSLSATATSFLEGLGLVEPDPDRDLIKRVIGLPGERVSLVEGVVHINGIPIEEPYTQPETRDFAEVRVPAGHYFVLGDNRGNSADSRYGLGFVPEENIIGRAFVILWPPGNATFSLDQDYPEVGETPLPVGSGEDDGDLD